MRTALVISPHADDAALFCGGTLARFADEGWRVVLVRVTDDRHDSVGLSEDDTLARNAAELREAAAILGVAEVVDLGFESGGLADRPWSVLRERFVYLFRKHRPHTVFSFDPTDVREDDPDHVRVARAVADAFRVSCLDKHHPEHLAEGLSPFAPAERWFFVRGAPEAAYLVDVTATIPKKIAAVRAQATLMASVLNRYRLQLRTAGRRVPALDAAVAGRADLLPLVELLVGGRARALAEAAGWPEDRFAEAFRRERFGDLEALFEAMGEDLPPLP